MPLFLCVLLRLASAGLAFCTLIAAVISPMFVREANLPIWFVLVVLSLMLVITGGFWLAGGWCLRQRAVR